MKTFKLPHFFFLAIVLILGSCMKNQNYSSFENSKWDGLYGNKSPLSLIIDEVNGNTFEGEIHWKNGKSISYVEGTLGPNDTINFLESNMVYGGGLVLDGFYPATISNDTIKGVWQHKTHSWSGTEYFVVKDTTFTGKTVDQKILTDIFKSTKELRLKMEEVLPKGVNPYKELTDSTKSVYTDLVREKREVVFSKSAGIENETIKEKLETQEFYSTFTCWHLAKMAKDSTWLMSKIEECKEGNDGYFSKQQLKLRLLNQRPDKSFYLSMLDKELSEKDQGSLLYDLLRAKDKYPELKPIFDDMYASLKESNSDPKLLKSLERAIERTKAASKMVAGAEAPEFEVASLKGNTIKLSDYKGKYVFVDFWGSWCGPCKGEIPNVKALAEAITSDKLQVLGLAKDDLKNLTEYLEKTPVPYPNAIVGDEVLASYGVSAFPTTFLIGTDGKIVAKNLRGEKLTEKVKEKMGI